MSLSNKTPGLDASVPANNTKIIELYNKLRSGQIKTNENYQRKLVWKQNHKFNFIETILNNYPFPEIYLAPGSLDQENLVLIDEIVDGQQRLTTVRNYIEGADVFAQTKTPIKKFSELTGEEKTSFLNYEVSVRYLKNATTEQVKEIFQRINKTDYALNRIERLNAQWGESEFICFAKQIIEPNFEIENANYQIETKERKIILDFFHGVSHDQDGIMPDSNEKIFTDSDMNRMLALQYIMTLVATLEFGAYFSRNDKIRSYIENFNSYFPSAEENKEKMLNAIDLIKGMMLDKSSMWFNKANLFTLIIELTKVDKHSINLNCISQKLNDFNLKIKAKEEYTLTQDEKQYIDYAREAVNEKSAREFRGQFLRQLIDSCVK